MALREKKDLSAFADYEYRLGESRRLIAQHQMRYDMLCKAKRWTYASLGFDACCVGVGGFLFHETSRLANEQASYVFAVTSNGFARRTFTPFPLFSSVLVLFGLISVPADGVALWSVCDHLQIEKDQIDYQKEMLLEFEAACDKVQRQK